MVPPLLQLAQSLSGWRKQLLFLEQCVNLAQYLSGDQLNDQIIPLLLTLMNNVRGGNDGCGKEKDSQIAIGIHTECGPSEATGLSSAVCLHAQVEIPLSTR
jgi:hypothetical protein